MEFSNNPQWSQSTCVLSDIVAALGDSVELLNNPFRDPADDYELGFKNIQLCMTLMSQHTCDEFLDDETDTIADAFNTAILAMAESITIDMEDC